MARVLDVTSILHDMLVDIDRAYLQSMMAEIGSDLSDITSASVGTLSGQTRPITRIQLSVPVAHTGFTTEVRMVDVCRRNRRHLCL
jgi:hypothetical protein